MDDNTFYWYWLNNIPGIGRCYIDRLLHTLKTPKEIYNAKPDDIEALLETSHLKSSFYHSKDENTIINSYKRLQEKRISFLHLDSVGYPRRLKELSDPPYGLYLKGRLPDEEKKSIAVIGARSCTRHGSEMARYFGRELASYEIPVISGLARGIDGMSHRGAMEENGYTLGILGCGIDQVYPKENYELFMGMEKTGGIVSEYNIGVAPKAGLFPLRNRLISAFCDGILVIEAMEKSGTFITVDQGLEQGKEIFALPGRITDKRSAGCNYLIKLGAHIVTDVKDIVEIFHMKTKKDENTIINYMNQQTEKMSLAPIEKMVYSCLRIEPRYLDDIIEEIQIAPQEVCMILNRMTVLGLVVETSRNYYAIRL